MLPVIFGHVPAGASTKQFAHYAQEFNSGRFCQYDYGANENLFRYHSTDPPEYDLKKIKSPISLYYSDNDWLSAQVDVEKLMKKLPNVKEATFIARFNHLDYVWGINAPQRIYKNIVRTMKRADLDNLFQNINKIK